MLRRLRRMVRDIDSGLSIRKRMEVRVIHSNEADQIKHKAGCYLAHQSDAEYSY